MGQANEIVEVLLRSQLQDATVRGDVPEGEGLWNGRGGGGGVALVQQWVETVEAFLDWPSTRAAWRWPSWDDAGLEE